MSRLPFDPSRMTPRPPPVAAKPTSDETFVTVSQLAGLVDRALRDNLPATLRVVGEIGQFRERTHWYFDLKDEGALISCVMFASAARRVGFIPAVGQQVLLTGRVEFYGKQGRTQFMADKLHPIGEGALDAAYRKLCEDLRARGWFDEERKRSLPLVPRRVAILTSRTGAALQDVLDTARRRCPSVPLALIDARVQGDGAADQLAHFVRRVSAMHEQLAIDVLLITRGGGSKEDLWCFNDRGLAEAIVHCPIPVVAAIGHETDITIAELVADVRAATPTQAAMRILPDTAALKHQLASTTARLAVLLSRNIRSGRDRLRGLARHPFLTDPATLITDRRDELADDRRRLSAAARSSVREAHAKLDRLAARLERHRPASIYARRHVHLGEAESRLKAAIQHRLRSADMGDAAERLNCAVRLLMERRTSRLDGVTRSLDLVGPHSVLKRGYSMTLAADGRIIRSATSVTPGDVVRTRLVDGDFASTVQGDKPKFAVLPQSSPRPPKRSSNGKPPSRDQMDLFGRPQ